MYFYYCTHKMKMLLLSPREVLWQGLEYVNVNYHNKKSIAYHQDRFQQHYNGSSPIDIAAMLYDAVLQVWLVDNNIKWLK